MSHRNRVCSFALAAGFLAALVTISAPAHSDGATITAADSVGVPEKVPDLDQEQQKHDEGQAVRSDSTGSAGFVDETTPASPNDSLRRAVEDYMANPAESTLPSVEAE